MKTKKKRKTGSVILHIVMFGLALIWLYPYIWLFLASVKPSAEIYTRFWPTKFTLEHFRFILESAERMNRPFVRAFFNSLFVSVTVTLCVLISSAIIAFALSKYKFKAREGIFNFIIFQMVFPGFMFTIPMYILIRNLNLLNSYGALILPSIMSGWGIFMLTQSFKGTPNDYIEAAKMDGASDFFVIFRIMVPLNNSAMAIVGLFTFIGIWDNFMWPLIVIQDYNKMPLSVLLATFNHEYGAYVGPIMAGSVIQTIPMVLIFIIFRKAFLQGISMTLK
ncbi:MAG TPA: carbohydrate ABC transporter permease [Defluviitoga tunisiensis]|jgi:multiple sugar transport system permease protein|nr:carbohydrate ABC transporter permease [Defluviitoga tunisiensis]HOB55372.1 carbohydrate ABC transporter permease [Defluviitoga tunisiensis]HOK16503.1 carbohydrate ABC transporter permease [Defluviitoga tunisiensis]HOL87305.1 carbohydrate ABC transporter permease [Defluviitoga tunisiensis]HOP34291.1 carbohydrate ABC transporter permease [Defluviitoga tunisiensis]